jgi:hypothetical protein
VAADLAAAVAALERLPAAANEVVRRIDADEEAPADAGDGDLAAATPRLRVLPLPAGEHPFLDEITATVEAAGQALAALVSDR